MPICEADPWRQQYFAGIACPAHVYVPTEDADAWRWNPRHRWVYDKIAVALSQDIEAGPHGTMPQRFPVFSKPITNLKGMGIGIRVIGSAEEYECHQTAGHMWMSFIEGRHVSSDVAVVTGKPCWWRHVVGHSSGNGTFDFWTVLAASDPHLEGVCGDWIGRKLSDYTGMLNLESIGGKIIEVHLRFSDQWPDLYGEGWIEALVGLYEFSRWEFRENERREGHSVVLFGPHGRRHRHPPPEILKHHLIHPAISSIQITFREDCDPARHAMPPGGFRLAIVNCFDLDEGLAVREQLREQFGLKASVRPPICLQQISRGSGRR